MMDKNAKIYVAGHRGMVGSAILRELQRQGYTNIITRTHKELDLTRQDAVEAFFAEEKPEYVFLAAAKVGGIVANEEALADFMYDNMTLEMNVIHSAWKNGCKKLEFLGSSCIYPRMAPQPMKEDCLLTSALEKTNEAYALAKISGLKYCEYLNRQYGTDYISVMPTNLYGPNDNYHPTHSHVVPALIRRFHEAKEQNLPYVTCWGDGSPLREFLYVDDLANLCVFLMNNYSGNETVNAGTGKDPPQAAGCEQGHGPGLDLQDRAGGRHPAHLPGFPEQSHACRALSALRAGERRNPYESDPTVRRQRPAAVAPFQQHPVQTVRAPVEKRQGRV